MTDNEGNDDEDIDDKVDDEEDKEEKKDEEEEYEEDEKGKEEEEAEEKKGRDKEEQEEEKETGHNRRSMKTSFSIRPIHHPGHLIIIGLSLEHLSLWIPSQIEDFRLDLLSPARFVWHCRAP